MTNYQSEEYRKVHFAIMAIEASAKQANISGSEMYQRLRKQDLIRQRLLRHYELLHTQSLEWVADDVITTLENWEKESEDKSK